jgi:hypothetical protein
LKIARSRENTDRESTQAVTVGLRVERGWIVGWARGERGGDLVFFGDDKKQYLIVNDNITDLFVMGDRVVAVAGFELLGQNYGLIYEVRQDGEKWHAKPWRALPGAPLESGKLESGEIAVVTFGGGIVALSENGLFREVGPEDGAIRQGRTRKGIKP